jgi:hypothetical protein
LELGSYSVIRVDGTETIHQGKPNIAEIMRIISCNFPDTVTIDRKRQTVMFVDDTGMDDTGMIDRKPFDRLFNLVLTIIDIIINLQRDVFGCVRLCGADQTPSLRADQSGENVRKGVRDFWLKLYWKRPNFQVLHALDNCALRRPRDQAL